MYDAMHFIDGEVSTSDQRVPNINPATGKEIGFVSRGTKDDVDRALAAARRASGSWRDVPVRERARILRAIGQSITKNAEELIDLEVLDTGRLRSEARKDAEIAARYFEFYGSTLESFGGETLPPDESILTYVQRVPYGVTGHIIPWNGPLQMVARTVAPSIATGNAAVVKPAEEASLTPCCVARLAHDAGLPAGVLNIVTGNGEEVGAYLAAHPDIDLISFTGSLEVGRLIGHAAAESVIPAILELGGKSPNLVFQDADIPAIVGSLGRAVLLNAGQICSAGSRVLAHDSIAEELLAGLKSHFEAIQVGAGLEEAGMGPLISARQRDRVAALVDSGIGSARLVSGGKVLHPEGNPEGFYYSPTLVEDSARESLLWREEVFGPVLVVTTFSSDEEAVELANDSDYGLAAGIWTRDISRAHRVAQRIQAGQIYINGYGAGPEVPFGGFKLSGIGREKGVEALRAFTQTRSIVLR